MILATDDTPSASGKPEAVFISWLLWQPTGADLAAEALKEIRKLEMEDRDDPDLQRLKSLFSSLAGNRGNLH